MYLNEALTSSSGVVVYRLGSKVPRGVADIGVVGEKGPSPFDPNPGAIIGLNGDVPEPFLLISKGCTRTCLTAPSSKNRQEIRFRTMQYFHS